MRVHMLSRKTAGRRVDEVLRAIAAASVGHPLFIQLRLSRNYSWTSRYRSRLIHAGVIEPAGRGRVRYALPCLGEFLAEHRHRYE